MMLAETPLNIYWWKYLQIYRTKIGKTSTLPLWGTPTSAKKHGGQRSVNVKLKVFYSNDNNSKTIWNYTERYGHGKNRLDPVCACVCETLRWRAIWLVFEEQVPMKQPTSGNNLVTRKQKKRKRCVKMANKMCSLRNFRCVSHSIWFVIG